MYLRSRLVNTVQWLRKGWNAIDLASQLLLAAVLLMRLAGLHADHPKLYVSCAASCAVLLWSKILFFMLPFATTGVPIRRLSVPPEPHVPSL